MPQYAIRLQEQMHQQLRKPRIAERLQAWRARASLAAGNGLTQLQQYQRAGW
jgi:hypothetical protein